MKINNSNINKVYYGDIPISYIYKAEQLVYSAPTSSPSPSPELDPLIYNSFYSCSVAGSGPPTNDYTVSGLGTVVSPLLISVGGYDNLDNRAWISINKTGILYYSVQASSEEDYDGGRLYLASISPTQHTSYVPIDGATPANYTALGLWVDGVGTTTGSVSVTTGSYLVLLYTKDSSESVGSDNVSASIYIV